ncbi:hypothetical protein FRC19_011726 [Serendipita sp. 401]|nr:hypothetical protein FRC15_004909 [Serendipita sp. 397]KAG8802507.1 hypothetical protein FRC16_009429 [Serendipita sp. 398]KAG8825293.1 hypothetical protein FRC19_011726 [Serendipita sp. 401]
MLPAGHRKVLSGTGLRNTPPRRPVPLENASPRSGTPVRTLTGGTASGSAPRSSTSTPGVTGSPSRVLTGVAKDSALTKQADAVLADMESKLQAQVDSIMSKLDEMSTRVASLDDSIQALLKNDFDDPDRSSTPKPFRRSSEGKQPEESISSPQPLEDSLLDEEIPFH